MKHLAIITLTLFLSLIPGKAQQKTYTNPIIQGFYPDPTICRVGDDFYLANSSFSFFPGLPIFHSKDLVHWKQIGNALDRVEQLNLDGLGISQGIYAPTLRYHQGVYYMVCTLVGGINNFVITATNPAGPWSNPKPLPYVDGMDPDLFFDDDGKAYVSSCAAPEKVLYDGHRVIAMHSFDPLKLTTSKESVILVNGGSDFSKRPVWCEGPHLYKTKGYYYLLCAEGGTSDNHSVVIFRSKSLNQPFVSYKNNPILTQRHLDVHRKNPITNTGHADLVQLPSGEWWSVFLACRPYNEKNHFNTGRETFMLPVKWDNGWPHILNGQEEVPLTHTCPPLQPGQQTPISLNGAFNYQENFKNKQLPFYTLLIRTPQQSFYTFPKNKNGIILNLLTESLADKHCPAFIGRRQQHIDFEVSTKLDFASTKENETAGIAAFQNDERYYLLAKNAQGFVLERGNAGQSDTIAEISCNTRVKTCYLKIKGNAETYTFSYSFDNEVWEIAGVLDASYLSTSESGGFVGTILGLYASANGQESQEKAYFNWLNYKGL